MKKKYILLLTFCSVIFAVEINAQIKTQSANLSVNFEKTVFNRGFKLPLKYAETRGENNSANQPVRRQTYVRPTKEVRLKNYASDTFGVPALISATVGATILQIGNKPREWEKNIGGFGKRYAWSYATRAIRNTISFGIGEAFKLENRFERSGEKKFGKRLKHVFLGSYTTRTKTGKRIPDFPHFIGTYSAAVIANETWYPKRFGYKDGLRSGTISLGVRFGLNLVREFINW